MPASAVPHSAAVKPPVKVMLLNIPPVPVRASLMLPLPFFTVSSFHTLRRLRCYTMLFFL